MIKEMIYCIADTPDFSQLAEMRWGFRQEDGGVAVHSKKEFISYCTGFLEQEAAD